jgi:hypothetical protein
LIYRVRESFSLAGGREIVGDGNSWLPAPYDSTGDKKLSPDGELYWEYDHELEKAADQKFRNAAVAEVASDIYYELLKIRF